MPRLPVSGSEQPAPVLQLTWPGIALGVAVIILWVVGDIWLARWLELDLSCLDTHGRRNALIETVICAASAGPRGWFYLFTYAAPFVVLGYWFKRRLRAARAKSQSPNEPPRD